MNICTWMSSDSFCCLQVIMTNVCSPFGRRTRVTWTRYWTISFLTLKSPRRIFWSQCLLWVQSFRTCRDGWWYAKKHFWWLWAEEKLLSFIKVGWVGLGWWINNFSHLPLSLIWRNLLAAGKDCPGYYAYNHAQELQSLDST